MPDDVTQEARHSSRRSTLGPTGWPGAKSRRAPAGDLLASLVIGAGYEFLFMTGEFRRD